MWSVSYSLENYASILQLDVAIFIITAIDSEYLSSGRVSFTGYAIMPRKSLAQIFHEANPRAFVYRTIPDSCARRVINLHKHAYIAYVCRRG